MSQLIPPFDFQRVVLDPWRFDWQNSLWIVLLGFLISACCGLLGNFLLLRRMALVGDAISHSVLPGLVLAYILFGTLASWAMLVGAAAAGIAAVMLIEFIQHRSRIKSDASTGITFTTLFAFGVLLIRRFADRAHLDVDCVLYGALETTIFERTQTFLGAVPTAILVMGGVTLVVTGLILLFYKELLVTSFDPVLATTLGIRSRLVHYLLMAVVSIVVVAALESVGAILVVGMIIIPPATARFFSDRLPVLLWLSACFSLLGALLGRHLGEWWNCPLAAAIAAASGGVFLAAWILTLTRRLLRKSF